MGGGAWTTSNYVSYTNSAGLSFDSLTGTRTINSVQENFKARHVHKDLKPYKVMRECCDSEEHPYTVPVILALDVTGSMSDAAVKTASALNNIITSIYEKVDDVEFAIMGIGDLAYDNSPIQISQFESDIRIAEHLDKLYFEFGGGGNSYESYTAAWYMGANHTKLDCWARGKRGIIITLGDENLNPYLPHRPLTEVTGDPLQGDVETKDLYEEVKDKYDVYHIFVDHGYSRYKESAERTFTEVIPKENYYCCKVDEIADVITEIVTGRGEAGKGISW